MKHLPSTAIVFLTLLFVNAGTRADEFTDQQIQDGLRKSAADYVIVADGAPAKLELHPTPLLKWSNPERSQQQGIVFVWHQAGSPAAIGSFFTFEYRGLRVKHEFHSLADGALSASYRGADAWLPKQPGVAWKSLPKLGSPRGSKAIRLTRMKQIASRFSVTLIDPEGDRRQLRLLRTPLHRFASPANDVVDGALFSFTVATDPEAMLLIRAKGGRWEYAFARFHYWQLEAKLDGARVWSAPLDQTQETNRLGDRSQMSKSYTSFYPEKDYLFRP